VFVPGTITPVPASDQSQSQESSGKSQLSLLRSPNPQQSDRLELMLITAGSNPIRKSVNATRGEVKQMVRQFRQTATDLSDRRGYLAPAQKMHQWLLAPLEQDLQQLGIENLVYIMDSRVTQYPHSCSARWQ
jgi:CHAT domain-containing protein